MATGAGRNDRRLRACVGHDQARPSREEAVLLDRRGERRTAVAGSGNAPLHGKGRWQGRGSRVAASAVRPTDGRFTLLSMPGEIEQLGRLGMEAWAARKLLG